MGEGVTGLAGGDPFLHAPRGETTVHFGCATLDSDGSETA